MDLTVQGNLKSLFQHYSSKASILRHSAFFIVQLSHPYMLLLLLSHFSRVQLCATPWTAAYQAPPSMGFSRKSTGVGCHFLLQCMHACEVASVASDSVRPHGQQPTRLLCSWDSLGKNTGVGCHFLLHPYMTTGKTIVSTRWTFVSEVMTAF